MSISDRSSQSPYPPPVEARSYTPIPLHVSIPVDTTPIMQQPPVKTKEGLKYLTRALISPVLAGILSLPLFLLILMVWTSPGPGSDSLSNLGRLLGGLAAGILAIVVIILVIMTFVYFIRGFKRFYDGRRELGPAHDRDVGLSLLFITVAFSATIIEAINNRTYPYIYYYEIVFPVSNVIRAVSLSLSLFYLVRDFGGPEMNGLRLGMTLLMAGPLAPAIPSLIGAVYYPYYYYYSFYNAPYTFVWMVLSMLGCFVFWVCYKKLYNKMESGEVRPIPPAPGDQA